MSVLALVYRVLVRRGECRNEQAQAKHHRSEKSPSWMYHVNPPSQVVETEEIADCITYM